MALRAMSALRYRALMAGQMPVPGSSIATLDG